MPRSKKVSQQMRAESRSAILNAARRLFASQGYFNCKVSEIASQAGMSTGNVYWYFSSKEELLKAVLADGFESLGTIMQQAAAQESTSHEKLESLLKAYVAFGRERGDFVTIFVSLLAHGGTPLLRELGFDLVQIGSGYHQSLSSIFAQGQRAGSVNPDIDPNILAMFFFSFFNGLMITYGEEWLDIPLVWIQGAVMRMVGSSVKGLAQEGG